MLIKGVVKDEQIKIFIDDMKNLTEVVLKVKMTDGGHKPETVTAPVTISVVLHIPLSNPVLILTMVQATGRTFIIPVWVSEGHTLLDFTYIMGEDFQTVVGVVKEFLYVRLYHNLIPKSHSPVKKLEQLM